MAVGVLGACLLAALGSWFTVARRHDDGGHKREVGLSERVLKQGDHIGFLAIDGMITEDEVGGFGSSGAGARGIIETLDEMADDDLGVLVLRINSPGGSAAASSAIHDKILQLKKTRGVKVVASFGDVAASGGYYIACAADRIVANPSTLTGSIGVIMHLMNYQSLLGKVGVNSVVIKSGKHKDIGSPDRPMTGEERQILQSIIDDTYGEFVQAVAAGRQMPVTQVRTLADGRIYTGRQALKHRLVDQLGNLDDALILARSLAKLDEDAEVVDYGAGDWKRMVKNLLGSRAEPLAGLLGASPVLAATLNKVPLMLYE